MKTLREAKIGDTVTVVKLHGEGAVKRRIMDMGITKGVTVHIRKVAPLGDPVEITVRGYELSLRKADAGMVEVESDHFPGEVRKNLLAYFLKERYQHGMENRPGGQPQQRQDHPV